MLNNIASLIKYAVTMTDVCERYGIEINRQGFAVCPFHNEKTPSLKIYDGNRGYSCFGCGKSGDVISFVQSMYGLSFSEALSKLNEDFGLNLPLERRMSNTEKYRFSCIERDRKRQETKRQRVKERYLKALDEWIKLDKQKKDYKPKSPDEELHPKFIEALNGLALAEFLLEEAESNLIQLENNGR